MKTALLTVMLTASLAASAQRVLEATNGSWLQQNLSVETLGSRVVTGFTETNSSGLLVPSFKVTSLTGAPGNSFSVIFPTSAYLMDFTLRPATGTIILTGMMPQTSTTPYRMYVAEVTMAGVLVQSFLQNNTAGRSMIPHQVIHSPTTGQVVVVGTEVTGMLTSSNTATIPKSGFVLGLDINNYSNPALFTVETNSPLSGGNDADMLETVTEVPGTGYFVSGSANHPSLNKQCLANIGVNYGGAVTHNITYTATGSLSGASAMYNPTTGMIYVLANEGSSPGFHIATFNPGGAQTSGFFRYPPVGLPTGVVLNGFRLQQTAANQIVVGGYIYAPSSSILPQRLTPFQILLAPTLSAFINGKYFQSGNNTTPTPLYFDETGAPVYVNTPDMIVYSTSSNKTYLVSQNSVMGGYDHDVASITNVTACETPFGATPTQANVARVSVCTITSFSVSPGTFPPSLPTRPMTNIILCAASAPLAPFTGSLSPNPATSQLKVELQEVAIEHISVIDLNGNEVMNSTPSQRSESAMIIDVSQLKAGMYLIRITDANGGVYSERFVKE